MKLNKAERELLKQKFGGYCAYCGVELNSMFQADHVIAVHRNITTGQMDRPEHDVFENLYPACMPCNNKKRGGDLEDFRKDLATMLDRMNTQNKFAFYQHAKRFGLIREVHEPVVFFFETYKPAPIYDWPNIPPDVQWMATDKDMVACGWLAKPHIMGDSWCLPSHMSAYFYIQRRNNPFKGDWTKSLEARPQEVAT